MKEALIKLRSDIFSGIEIDVNDKKILNKFKREHPQIDLAKAYSIAKSQLVPVEITGILYSDVDNFHKAVAEINDLLDFPGLNLDAEPQRAYSTLLVAFERNNLDAAKIKELCEYLDKRAKIAVQKGKTEAAESIGKFTSDCKKLLTNNQYAKFVPAFSKAYSPVINEIKKIKGSNLGIIQYRDLSEKCFSLLNASAENTIGFQLILGLIALQCKDFKMELPSITTTTECPHCGEKVSAGNICQKCGGYIKCPGCKKTIVKGSAQCIGCGVEVAKIGSYEKALSDALYKLNTGNISGVEESIRDFAVNWSKYDKLVQVKDLLSSVKDSLNKQEQTLNKAIQALELQKAQQIARKILENGKSSAVETTLKDIQAKLSNVDSMIRDANNSNSWLEKLTQYKRALSICADHSVALQSLSSIELNSPLNISMNITGRNVSLSWDKYPANFISYVVVRKVNDAPKSINDGEKLSTLNENKYIDVTTEAGVSYYYAVFTKIDDKYSKSGSIVGPVLTVVNLDTKLLKFDIQENHISFNFTLPKNTRELEIFRDGKLIKTTSGSSFIDNNLKSDTEYQYKFVAVFENNASQKSKASGVSLSLTPTSPPKPVDLDVNETDQKAVISWKTPSKGVLNIYCASKPFSTNKNDIISEESFNASKLTISGNSYTLNKDFSGVRYYLPIVILGGIGVVGEQISVISILEPKDVTFDKISERTFEIGWKWDDNIDSVKITSQVDGGRNIENIISKENTSKPKFTVTSPQGAKSILTTIQTRIVTANGKELLSGGVKHSFNLEVAKVSFMEVKQGGFFSRSSFTLTIQADSTLPCNLELLIGEGRTPIDLNNYRSFLTIDSNELVPNQKRTFSFKYSRNDKKKPLIFRLIPSNQSMFRSMIIQPETKQIK